MYVHHYAAKGGASISLKNLIVPLQKRGIEPLVLSPSGSVVEMFRNHGINCEVIPPVPGVSSLAGAPLQGIRLLRVLPSLIRLFSGQSEVMEKIDQFKPDLVHLNERHMWRTASLVSGQGIPVVMHARSVASKGAQWAHAGKYIRKYVDQLVAIDESVQHALSDVAHAKVVYNSLQGIDQAASMSSVNIDGPKRPIRFVFLSNLLVYKGLWEIVEAVKLLKDRNDFEVKILGTNSRPPEFFKTLKGKVAKHFGLVRELDQELQAFIKLNNLESKIELCGFVDEFEEFLESIDVNLFPSHLNGPSRSVFETGIRGIPTILALEDKIEDVVEDGKTGFIIPPRSPLQLAKAMERLIEDDDLRNKLGANSKQKYRKLFDPELNAATMFEIYCRVTGCQETSKTTSKDVSK